MKTASILTVIALMASGCASTNNARSTSEILQREREWTAATRARDATALDAILATEFRLSFVDIGELGPRPTVTPRERWLANTQQMSFGPVHTTNERVTMHGPNVATVRMHMTLEDWKWGERTFPPHYNLTDIWVYRDGRWQVVNRISEPVKSESPHPPN